jgi:Tol biopolymer transport system component
MAESHHSPIAVRFGPFQVSSESGELRRNGVRVKLSGQAIEVLLTLLENPGRVVTREELQRRLWPDASFGDFDHGLNAAVNRLREVLADSATLPTFIETVPRRGYRFIGEIQLDRSPDDVRPTDVLPGEKVSPDRKAPARSRFGRRWRFGTAAAAVLVVVCTSAYHLRREPARPETRVTVVPLTTYPGLEMMPSFSPDGTQIAFAWYREFGRSMAADLYVKQVGNEHAVRLTKHEARYVVPAWSPDGRSIAFAMAGKSGNGIYIMPSLGGPERLLARLADNYWQYLLLSWSPDSRLVAFTSDAPTAEGNATPGRFRIHLADIETGEERLLPPPSPDCWIVMEPAFSPDGTYLASVCVLNESVNKIYVQRPDGGDAREVAAVNNARVLNGIGWTPDSRSIVYGGQAGRLWRAAISGGAPEELTFAHDAQQPAVAVGVRRLAYSRIIFRREIWRVDLAAPDRAAGTASKIIASSLGQQAPSASPDGSRIAFESARSGTSEIWVCDRDGSNPVQLSFLKGPETQSPRWSPDGRRIVFASHMSGQGDLFIVNADGGPVRRLATTLPASHPAWSADGKWIYFDTRTPPAIWKLPADGGAAVQLTSVKSYGPQESADGKRLFFVVGGEIGHGDRDALWSVSVDGGDQRPERGMPTLRLGAAWAPAQGGIYFIAGSESNFFINYFDFATNHLHTVTDLPGLSSVLGGMAVSPNNDALLFTGIDHGEADIMLVDNFR